MAQNFAERLSDIRHEKGISQRKAAADLKISQALLSHYENGAREPGLLFVSRACDYYGVSADFLLGRTEDPEGGVMSEPITHLRPLLTALKDRNSAEVSAAAGKYLAATGRMISAEIYGIADAKTMARCRLEQAEAENAIITLFPALGD